MNTWLPVVAFMMLVVFPTAWMLYCFREYVKGVEESERRYRRDIEAIRRQYGDWRK